MILRLVALAAVLAVLAVLSPDHLTALSTASVVVVVCAALASRGVARPWTALAAWAAAAGALAWAGGPQDDAPWTLLLAVAAVAALAVALHFPQADIPPVRGLPPIAVLFITWAVVAVALSWPLWSLRSSRLGLLDPVTPAGTALRMVVLLVLAAGTTAVLVLLRSRLSRPRDGDQSSPGPQLL